MSKASLLGSRWAVGNLYVICSAILSTHFPERQNLATALAEARQHRIHLAHQCKGGRRSPHQPGGLSCCKSRQWCAHSILDAPLRPQLSVVTALLQVFQPELYKLYDQTLTDLCERDPTLRRNFHHNVFACATFNVGPNTMTHKHLDFLNLPYGMCAVTPLGNYDHTRGGHIVLWELRMIIEFPPMCSGLIPSGVISHSNIAIQPGETRHSFTQYSAGGLFRWRAAGYQTLKNLRKGGGELPGSGHERWKSGVEMWSKWEDIKQRLEAHRSSSDKAV